jgi:hypothetical protein
MRKFLDKSDVALAEWILKSLSKPDSEPIRGSCIRQMCKEQNVVPAQIFERISPYTASVFLHEGTSVLQAFRLNAAGRDFVDKGCWAGPACRKRWSFILSVFGAIIPITLYFLSQCEGFCYD